MNEEWRERATPLSAPRTGNDGTDDGDNQSNGRSSMRSLVLVVAAIVLGAVFARDALTSAALFLFILLGLVMAHESAHFFTAKAFGIFVHEFAFGFPPRVWGKRIGDTLYSINWLPIGGFVRLEGEEAAWGVWRFCEIGWQGDLERVLHHIG